MWCMLRLLMWQDGGGLRVGICIVFVFVLYFVVYALLGGGLRVGGATILSWFHLQRAHHHQPMSSSSSSPFPSSSPSSSLWSPSESSPKNVFIFLLQLARAAAAIFLAGYRGWVYGYHVCSAVSLLGTQRVVKLEEGLEGCCESGLGRVSRVCCYSDKGRGCVGVSMRRGNGRGVQSCTEIQSFG